MIDGEATLEGRRILVVEDDYLVAQVLVDIIEAAGAQVIGPVGWVHEAITLIESGIEAFDGAILDVNLHGKRSYPIADALATRGIGFVFATGYGADTIDGAYLRYPRCEKPFTYGFVVAALTAGAGSKSFPLV
jgi:CheY-like chemotaxis protein